MIKDIRHTGIVVRNVEQSLSFYCDMLGFEIVKDQIESGDFISHILDMNKCKVRTIKMKCNKQMIELLKFNIEDENTNVRLLNSVGCSHIAFTVEDLDYIYNNTDDVYWVSKPKIDDFGNVKVAFCKDPNGVFIELVEEL